MLRDLQESMESQPQLNGLADILGTIKDMAAATTQAINKLSERSTTKDDGVPEFNGLPEFRKANPPKFHGGYGPEAAELWLKEIEKIFRTMRCTNNQKLTFATYVLEGEAEYWWECTQKLLETGDDPIYLGYFQSTLLG